MRVVIQRVSAAAVSVNGLQKGAIKQGLMVLVGIEASDCQTDIDWMASKITQLRIFNDAAGVMNCNVKEIAGGILLISQFTLQAATKKGNRPSYIKAATPAISIPIYEAMIQAIEKEMGTSIQTGEFGADMQVSLVNDGPVTIIIDSKNKDF